MCVASTIDFRYYSALTGWQRQRVVAAQETTSPPQKHIAAARRLPSSWAGGRQLVAMASGMKSHHLAGRLGCESNRRIRLTWENAHEASTTSLASVRTHTLQTLPLPSRNGLATPNNGKHPACRARLNFQPQ